MINRLIPAAITIFWLVMTATLVRTEFFPKPVEPVPLQQIVALVFDRGTNSEKFTAYYREHELGTLEITATQPRGTTGSGHSKPRKISLTGNLDLKSFGINARLRLNPVMAEIDANNNIQDFIIDAGIVARQLDDINVKLTGNGNDPRMRLEYTTNPNKWPRTITAEGDAASLVTAMAQELGFAQVGLVNSFLKMATQSPPHTAPGMAAPVISGYRSQLEVQGVLQPMYLIEARSSDHLWTKIWVSRLGEIVLIESSAELGLRNVNMYPSATNLPGVLDVDKPDV
jgi:hypothetical protein